MPLFTTLAALSQTPANNPPDGAVDAPSTIDDQMRLLGSFIAQLRDNSGFTSTPLPAGTLIDYAGGTAPTGFLACDGSAVSRATYASLFTAIGTTWGAGDGSTTFNVPDFRGRATIGSGTGSGLTARTLGATMGEETHALTTAELAAHNHGVTISDAGHVHSVNDPSHSHTGAEYTGVNSLAGGGLGTQARFSGAPGTFNTGTSTTGISLNTATTGISASSSNTGSGTAHNNMQPSAVVNKIIKT